MKRRIPLGTLSGLNFATLITEICNVHELISANCFCNSLHKIDSFLLSINLLIVMFGGEFQLNVQNDKKNLIDSFLIRTSRWFSNNVYNGN